MPHKLISQFYPFFKYCIVGAIGTSVDFLVFIFLAHVAGWHYAPATLIAFLVAAIHNFFLNKIWTFQNTSDNYRKLWIKFFLVSITGLLLTLFLMYVFIDLLLFPDSLSKILASGVAVFWNFLANKFWTFCIKERDIPLPKKYETDVSVVIPAFNEEKRIAHTILCIDRFFQHREELWEIIVVDDGSTDATEEVVKKLQENISHLRFLNAKKNHGKGYAVKRGVWESRGKYILMTDADNSTPIEEWEYFWKVAGQFPVLIGSRYLAESRVERKQPFFRRVIGRIGNAMIQFFLLDGIRDTQCGFKLFEHKAAKEIFSRQKVFRFGFDIEALTVGKILGYEIKELPVSWYNSPQSRVRPFRDAFRTFFDLIYIKLNLWSGRYW